ncbi:MAG TPA: hypothetical protein VG079_03510 [Gaiellaceae bacterium]|nr:hypothetical protein [Gaiellaceae bacterium]
MDTLLGLLGLTAWIAAVIVLASTITWLVVRFGPGEKPSKQA